MKLITVTGYKGGCGKSTTAIHLATYFSDRGKTLLIDSDQRRLFLPIQVKKE
ncbi:MAG: ParA family protein [Xenococcus sp. MO_188.B8]|nr:ParA family protein [Xenococcus sp. MO_188.B8]